VVCVGPFHDQLDSTVVNLSLSTILKEASFVYRGSAVDYQRLFAGLGAHAAA